jgi:hypothetical protein
MINSLENSNKNKTFKPKKNISEGTKQHQLQKYAEATLGAGNLRTAVALPEGEDENEWLAVNSMTPKLYYLFQVTYLTLEANFTLQLTFG